MSDEVTITLKVDRRLADDLTRLATMLDRPLEDLAISAVSDHVGEELAFLDSLDEAEAAIDRGDFYTQEQMKQWFEVRRSIDRAA